MRWSLNVLDERHLPQVVEIHTQAFPGFFLTFLGRRFLREFYRSFFGDPAGIAFVAEADSGAVLGVVVGPLVPDGYFRRLLRRRWWAFAMASLTAVLRRPAVAVRLLRAVSFRGDVPSDQPRALLSSLTVSPSAQGQGIGGALVRRWAEEVCRHGVSGCFLTTDADRNEGVNQFYAKLGWTIERSYFTPEGRRMNRYILDFPTESAFRDVA